MTRFVLPLTISLAAISLATIAILVFKGLGQPQNATPSKASGLSPADPSKCQGNANPSAKCFDCHKDATDKSQVNTLDFSCFAKFYGKRVGTEISSTTTTPPPISTAGQITKKVQLLIFNPTMPNGQKLVSFRSWNDPDQLTNQFVSDVRSLSNNLVTYQISERVVIDSFNEKADGFKDTANTYLSCLDSSQNCHQPDLVNYQKILDTYQSCEKVNSGAIDEVWLWGGPYFGYWEAVMTGPGAFSTNASPFVDSKCQKKLNIMGFNYERGVPEMLEDLGHRTEGTMAQVFGEDPRSSPGMYSTPWGKFASSDKISPGNAGCGWMHFAPNSLSDYDWSNSRSVPSTCDDWLNYPNLAGTKQSVSCNNWNCTDYEYKKWWFRHLPNKSGKTGGKLNNWWSYVVDYDNAATQ